MRNKIITGKTILPLVLVLLFFLILPAVRAPFNNCPGDTTNGWWDISNAQTVNTTANIICEYINISNGGRLYINSSMGNHTVNITIGNLTIQAGGEINGTGTGFRNETGEGRGGTAGGGGGAGHGGRGGDGQAGAATGGAQYGNPLEPRTLGSGGGDNTRGAPGGGAVIINVSNITWVNGTIAINGEPAKTGGGGGGSGGSLFLDTDRLQGIGTIEALGGQGNNAANDGGSGGGGRIAVYYKTTAEGFSFNNTRVFSPPGITSTADQGEPGTAVFVHKDNKELYIVGGFEFTLATYNYSNVTIEHAFLRVNQTFELNATQLINTARDRITNMSCYNQSHDSTFRVLRGTTIDNINMSDRGVNYYECGNFTIHRIETRTNFTVNLLTLQTNATLILNLSDDDLILNATLLYGNINLTNLTNLSIYSTSMLNASSLGHPNATGEGLGGRATGSTPGCGGGYGGLGGRASTGSCTSPGQQYGDPFAPRHLGSAGGGTGGGNLGKPGGGFIYINVSGTLWNNGTIVADGADGRGITNDGGSGSGGSIWIDSINYYGSGSLYARGGTGANQANDAGSGGGGRIAVYYNTINSEVAFNNTRVNTQYVSGIVAASIGDPGTAIFIDKNDRALTIVGGFDFNLATYNFSNVTIEHAFLRVNTTFELNATVFENTGRDRITNMSCYNLSYGITFRLLRSAGMDNLNISDYGRDYDECGNITIQRLETRTNYSVSRLTVQSNGTLEFNVTNDTLVLNATLLFGNLNLTVTNLTADSTSSLIANFRGLGNGTGAGKGGTNGTTNVGAGGAGYGGPGGHGGTAGAGGTGGVAYGSNVTPNDLGSGGAGPRTGSKGGVGGGAIFINATNKFEFNGTINASGGVAGPPASTTTGGGGSGGSIWIWTRIVNGTGTLSAHGGDTDDTTSDGGGGGGGRIAVYFRNDESNGFTRDVRGGEGFGAIDGAAGTIEFLQTNDTVLPTVATLRPTVNTFIAANTRVNISMTVTDNDAVSIVLINITYPDNTTKVQLNISNFTQVGSIFNHSFADTATAGAYNITYFANDTTGNRNETERTNFTVDTVAPAVGTLRPVANNFTGTSTVVNISATVTDGISGVSVVLANVTYPDNTTKEQLRLVNSSGTSPAIFNFSFGNTSTEGHYNITFIANDTVNNINSGQKTNFTVDSTGPTVTTLRPAANTVFDNASIVNISATVTDLFLNVDVVFVNLTYPDNTSKEQFTLARVGSIYNFSINVTNQSGTYNVTFIANDTAGNINSTQKTNFTMNATIIPVIDIANTTNITFTPDPIRQNEKVSFNATFNVTGNINATGLNVTLTVDNTFVTSTSFNLANGTTRVVELNWTAENGTHAIRLNADANNTFTTETFENNNNATVTVSVLNVSVLNFSSPSNNSEIIRGLDTSSLPGEDTMKAVSNLTTISARVYNRYATGTGVNSNCTFYFNDTVFLGWNQTNTTGECTFTFDHTIYATAIYNITVNYTNLNTTNYLADTSTALIQNTSRIDLGKVEVDLDAEDQRSGSVYNPGDVAVMNITVTKNSTAFDPNRFTVQVKNPGAECTSTGGILFNHSYPGDVVRISTGLFQSYSILEVDTDIHWCVIVNDSASAPLGSATHSDKEVTNTNANRANFTTLNSADGGDDAVFDDINITFITRTGRTIFDRNFSTTDPGERRVITLNDRYDILFRHPGRQEQLNITGLNITAANRSLPFTLLTNYSGRLPSNFTNITSIIAFNNSGFTFTTANITLQKANLTISKILHCTNWNFSSGSCIGDWEINQTSAYANYGENATHLWFQVASFTAYGGGNGSNANLTIYDQNDTDGGSLKAELAADINFTANYTKLSDRSAITGATCNATFSTAPAGPSAMTYDSTKQIYNFTRTFSSAGNFTWNVTCGGSGFDTTNASDTIEIVDTAGPTVSSITPIVVTSETTTTFSATVTDNGTVTGCNLFVARVNDGAMTLSGSTASRAVLQSHPRITVVEMYANCTDVAGNRNFTRTNITVEPLQSGGGDPGGGTRAGGESSAATADGLEGGERYESLENGDSVSITGNAVQSYARVVSVMPNSVRIDVGGLYNIVLLEGLFRKFDLNRNGIMETTIYVDDVVSYSKADISILVEDDGGAPVQATPQNLFTLAEIWQKVKTQKPEETVEEQEEPPKQEQEYAEEQREEIPLLQTPSVWLKILNGIVKAARAVEHEASITGGVVMTETNTFVSSTILKSTATKITTILLVTVGLLGSCVVTTYVSGRRGKKREEELDALLEKEMQYKGLQ